MPDKLPTAGQATSQRARLELEMASAFLPALRVFLNGVEKDALAAMGASVLLAAGRHRAPKEPFTLGSVLTRWKTMVSSVELAISEIFHHKKAELPADYLARAMARIQDNALPSEAHAAVKEVLSNSAHLERSVIAKMIAEALSVKTGTATRVVEPGGDSSLKHAGPAWQASAMRIVRTEATAAYNVSALAMMAGAGAISARWVSHHDQRVRATHLAADGQTIPIDAGARFLVGGEALEYPGDPAGSHAQTSNCRCVVIGVRAGE